MRILLVEDSVRLQASIAQGLRESSFAVDVVGDGRQGLIHALTTEYDVIVLDLMLPELSGLEVLRALRDRGVRSGILILTAMDTIDDRVRGLRGGADDYLVKPFSFAELVARVQALARRLHGVRDTALRCGPLVIDTAGRSVRVEGRSPDGSVVVDLTPREYSILEYLAHRAGCAVTRSELEEHLYDERSQVMSNAVDVAISALRAKLERAGCPAVIQTKRKFGYMLTSPGEASEGQRAAGSGGLDGKADTSARRVSGGRTGGR